MSAASHPTGTFEGPIWWVDIPQNRGDSTPVDSVIVTTNRIAFDFPDDNAEPPDVCTVTLAPSPDGLPSWAGTWRNKIDQATGAVEARMYTSSDGGVALVGVRGWHQYGKQLDWFIDLAPQASAANG